jgi:GT2 family glycosyltransferase/glycosyltransferase involved in cell wall biosynthesis
MILSRELKVSVVVQNRNTFALTSNAVASVLSHTDKDVEIILVDNGSDSGDLEELKNNFKDTRVSILSVGVNRFTGEGNNIGAESATGDILIFLNNQVMVTENWLEPLIDELQENPNVGAVGPKFLYPDGSIREAGAFLDRNGQSVQRGKGQNSGVDFFNEKREVQYVSADCFAIRKKDFLKVGGFNFVYEPAHYEDVDLCFSLRTAGLSVVYQPESTVIDMGTQAISNTGSTSLFEAVVEMSRIKFLNRWGNGESPSRLVIDTQTPPKPIASGSPTVVIYTPFDLVFGGGEKYILSVAHAYSFSGFRTILATKARYSRVRLMALGLDFGLDLGLVELSTLDEVRYPIDTFITMGNEVYPPVDPIGKINIHHCQFPFPPESQTNDQVSRLNKIDCVVVNSEYTKGHYLRAAQSVGFNNLKVIVISPPISDLPVIEKEKNQNQILSVGRFFVHGHSKNQHMLITAFRDLLIKHPKATLVLVGGLAPGSVHREYLDMCRDLAKDLPVTFQIDAERDEISTLMESSSIYWHGAGFDVDPELYPERCEHFGISLVEAMGSKVIPVVVGNGGPDEIVQFGVNGFKYQSVEGLIRRTGLIFDLDDQSREMMRKAARARFEEYIGFDFDAAWTSLAPRK